MSRVCKVTGKAVMTGNNVSHANNRTRRRFLPNLQDVSFFSETLNRAIKLRVSAAGIRTVEHKGGIDAYLVDTAATKLSADLRPLKKQVEAKQAASK